MITILCVEDEDTLRIDLVDELTEAGYTVLQAQDGEEALAVIKKHRPSLILCDISMPKIGGFELLQKVRSEVLVKEHIPFIFLSAHAGREHVITGLDRGCDDYLVKPVDYGLLLAKVKAALRQSQRVQNRVLSDHVKIYKALSGQDSAPPKGTPVEESLSAPASDASPKTVALVGKRSERTSVTNRVLQALGHHVLPFSSGKVFLESADTLLADSIILDFYTDDCQAPMLSKLLSTYPHLNVPMMLLWPQEHGELPEGGGFSGFDATLTIPLSPDADWVQQELCRWLAGQWQYQPAGCAPPSNNGY